MADGLNQKDFKIYVSLMLMASVMSGLYILAGGRVQTLAGPVNLRLPLSILLNMIIVFFLYGLLGLFGFKYAGELGLPGIWRVKYPGLDDYYRPFLAGLITVVLLVGVEVGFNTWHGLGNFPQPDLPAAIFLIPLAAVGDEVLYRLFLIPLIIKLLIGIWRKLGGVGFSRQEMLEGKFFWTAAVISGILYTVLHGFDPIHYLQMADGAEVFPVLIFQALMMNLILSLLAAWQYRKRGFLPAVVYHLGFGLGWYIIWGNIII